jgi:hypothetical protein
MKDFVFPASISRKLPTRSSGKTRNIAKICNHICKSHVIQIGIQPVRISNSSLPELKTL